MEENKNTTDDRLQNRDKRDAINEAGGEPRPAQQSPTSSLRPRRTPMKNPDQKTGSVSFDRNIRNQTPAHSAPSRNIVKPIPAEKQNPEQNRFTPQERPAEHTESRPVQTVSGTTQLNRNNQASQKGGSGAVAGQGNRNPSSRTASHPAAVTDEKATKKAKAGKKEDKPSGEGGRTAVSSIIKAVVYIVCVLVVAVFLSYAIISVGNDMYALVKDDTVIEVELTDYMTIDDIADLLHDNGLIEHPAVFRFYTGMKNAKREKKYEFISGTYEVSPSMSYDEFIKMFAHLTVAEREQIKITIPEGYTVDEIIELFLSNGMGTREGFVDAINNYDYGTDFRFLEELPAMTEDRKYRLEGYLFPDTYYFYKDSGESAIIYKLLETFELRVTEEYYTRAEEMGMSMDEVVTLASIIQAEAKLKEDFLKISAVLNNRLNHADQYPKLQSDATIQYILEERRTDLTVDDLKIDNKYNTYEYPGLPPSAIGNPGTEAINAALGPLQEYLNNGYYFFVSAPSGVTYYARTAEEHEANKTKIKTGEYK